MNKVMFWIGIAIMAITAGLFLFVEEDFSGIPYILFFIGIGFMGASQYRPMKQKKK
jgi:hypothetical protein